MVKVIITAQVDDVAKWEQGFRTHNDMFKSIGVASPIMIGTSDENEVALYEEVADLEAVQTNFESPETIAAMEKDGVRRDTVKIFVLDKEVSF